MSRSQSDIHDGKNQESYDRNVREHDSLSLNSTLYLAYRDVGMLIERHLFSKLPSGRLRFLDYGCGVGLSTQIVLHHLKKSTDYTVEATGVDINEANLALAQEKLPRVTFKRISPGVPGSGSRVCVASPAGAQPSTTVASETARTVDSEPVDALELEAIAGTAGISPERGFDQTEKFDLITCNFVLVEMKEEQMLLVLEALKNLLSENGVIIVTNPTARAYRPENRWYTFNNQFVENVPTRKKEATEKLKYVEDQAIKIQVFASAARDQSFTFFDYFHSGSAYRRAYAAAGLTLLETHKPIGKPDDNIAWCAEAEFPPYKLHVLGC